MAARARAVMWSVWPGPMPTRLMRPVVHALCGVVTGVSVVMSFLGTGGVQWQGRGQPCSGCSVVALVSVFQDGAQVFSVNKAGTGRAWRHCCWMSRGVS